MKRTHRRPTGVMAASEKYLRWFVTAAAIAAVILFLKIVIFG